MKGLVIFCTGCAVALSVLSFYSKTGAGDGDVAGNRRPTNGNLRA